MERDQAKEKLLTVINSTIFEQETEIDMDANICEEYGINSVLVIKLIVEIENAFSIEFTDYELDLTRYSNFNKMLDAIVEKFDSKNE